MRAASFLLTGLLAASTAMAADVTGLLSTLQSLNLTELVGSAQTIANTTGGARLLDLLASNTSLTLLAPNNAAFAGVNPYFANDPTWLQQALAYHTLIGTVQVTDIPKSPNNAIYPTALNDTSIVSHLGGAPQYIGLVRVGNTSYVSNQNNFPSVVTKTLAYQNVLIHVVTAVVDLPPSALDAIALTSYTWTSNLTTTLSQLNTLPAFTDALVDTPSLTFFAPINSAWSDAVKFGHLPSDLSGDALQAVLENHVINGTVVFTSPSSPQKQYTSAGGETLTFGKGGAFGYVVYYKGDLVANVVYPDIITKSGVMHLIDAVLPNESTDAGKASEAWSSAVAQATQTTWPVKRAEKARPAMRRSRIVRN